MNQTNACSMQVRHVQWQPSRRHRSQSRFVTDCIFTGCSPNTPSTRGGVRLE